MKTVDNQIPKKSAKDLKHFYFLTYTMCPQRKDSDCKKVNFDFSKEISVLRSPEPKKWLKMSDCIQGGPA